VRVILDDDEVSSDEYEPLQMRLWPSSTVNGSSGPESATADVMAAVKATVDKEAMDKRAAEEATAKEATDTEAANKRTADEAMTKEAAEKVVTDKRAMKEAATKEAADKEATDKRATEEAAMKEATVGATGGSSASGQVPSSVMGAKRVAMPSVSTPSAKRPYRGVWKPRFVQFSCTPLFLPRSKVQL
jgi:hypothetical protein